MRQTKSLSFFRTTLLVLATMITITGQAQLGTIANGIADKRREKKIEKSPAKDHIIAVEKNLPILDKEINKYKNPKEHFPKDDKGFDKFNKPYQSIEENLALLKKKDPKWDVSDYDTQFSKLKPTFKSIESNYNLRLKAMELTDSVSTFPRQPHNDFRFGYNKACTSLFNEFKNFNTDCNCGEQHYSFYVETMKVRELRKLLTELAPIIKHLPYPSSYSSIKEPQAKRLIEAYLDDYDELLNKWLKRASMAIENSKTHNNAFQSLGVLNYSLKVIETALEISDVRSDEFEAKRVELNERILAVQQQRLKDNKITDENRGKIFFLPADISREDFSQDMAISSWDLSKPIYFRWFMASTPQEMHQKLKNADVGLNANRDAVMTHIVYINGKEIYRGIYDGFTSSPGLYSDALTMRGRYDGEGDGIYIKLSKKILDQVSLGTHKMKIEAYMDGHKADMAEKPFAVGEVNLKVTAAGLSKIKSNPEVCFQKAGMQNASVSQNIKALIKEELKGKSAYSVRIISKDWVVQRNKYSGAILSRGLDAVVLFKGGSCEKLEVWVEQKYNGNGHYAPLEIDGISETVDIPCKCVQ